MEVGSATGVIMVGTVKKGLARLKDLNGQLPGDSRTCDTLGLEWSNRGGSNMRLVRALVVGSFAAVFWFPTAAFSQGVRIAWPVVFSCPISPATSPCTAVDRAGRIFLADRNLDVASFNYVTTIKVSSGATKVSCDRSVQCALIGHTLSGKADVWYVYTPTTP